MRAWIISDIHLSTIDRFWGTHLKIPAADLCICAGDVSDEIDKTIRYLQTVVSPKMPVVLVLGNHDYFGVSIEYALEKARRAVENSNVHLLENDSLEIGTCRFIGATLWTDFAVEIGGDEHLSPEERRTHAFQNAPRYMLDFHLIFRSDEREPRQTGSVTVQEIFRRHKESRAYIDQELSKSHAARTIVISHHAPLPDRLDARFHGQVTNACFASDLSSLITLRRPSIWIHGHIHRARDYMFGSTRILCNPRGNATERESNGFRPGFVIDL